MYFTAPVTYDEWEQAQAWVVRTSPLHRAQQFYEQFESPDSSSHWILVGTLVTASLALCAVLLVGVDDRERARRLSSLQLLGVSQGRLLAIHLVESLVGALAAVLLAAGSAWVVASAFLAVNDEANRGLGPLLIASAFGLCVVVGLGGVVHAVAQRRANRRRQR